MDRQKGASAIHVVLPLFIVRNFLRRIESPPRIIAELGQSFRKSNVRDETNGERTTTSYIEAFFLLIS